MIDARIRKAFPGSGGSAPFELDIHLKSDSEITVLFGPSGAGKSLSLDCIAGFVRPDEGRILVDDRLLFDAETKISVPSRHRGCGCVFQSESLFPHMSLYENLWFAAAARAFGRTAAAGLYRARHSLPAGLAAAGRAHTRPGRRIAA